WHQNGSPSASLLVQGATGLYMTFGLAMWLVPVILLVPFFMEFSEDQLYRWRRLSLFFVPVSAGLCALAGISVRGVVSGGVIGQRVVQCCQRVAPLDMVPSLLGAFILFSFWGIYGSVWVIEISSWVRYLCIRVFIPVGEVVLHQVVSFCQELWSRWFR